MKLQEATNYVILAVGGTGAKVAEAAVNLMSLGLPMTTDQEGKGYACLNANDALTIIRIDPDKACRDQDLQGAIKLYQEIQKYGGRGQIRGLWSLELRELVKIHPMDALSGPKDEETLKAKLASNVGQDLAVKILRLFYTESDLTTSLDRGFFQKPYIGSAVIASMAETKVEAAPALIQHLKQYKNKRLRVFIVGSMYGGTGAAGIPVLSRIVKYETAENDDWRVAGCLLGPYFYPPLPPISEIDWGPRWNPDMKESVDVYLARERMTERQYLEGVARANEGKNLGGPGQEDYTWQQLRMMARGYYAKPAEIERRAFAS